MQQDRLSMCSSQTGGFLEESTVDEDCASVHSTEDARRSPRQEWDSTLPLGGGLRSDTVSQNNTTMLPSNGGRSQFEQPEVVTTV